MLWDVGEERAGGHVIQSSLCALQEGVWGVSVPWALGFRH